MSDDDESLNRELCRAAGRGDLALVRQLVEKRKVRVDPEFDHQERAAWIALTRGKRDVLAYLIKKRADREALWWHAAESGEVKLLKTLFDLGLEPGNGFIGSDGIGGTALQRAVTEGHIAAVKFLLGRGVDPDKTGMGAFLPPVGEAAANGNVALTRLLLAAGARPLAHDGAALVGATDGMGASTSDADLLACFQLLHAASHFDVNALYPRDTLLTLASKGGRLPTVKWLLGLGADPNKAGTGFGNPTPIVMAARTRRVAVVRELLEHGVREDQRVAALLAAASGKHRELIELLVAHGTPTDDPEVRKALKRAGVVPGKPSRPCDPTSITTLFATFAQRPGGPDAMDLLSRGRAKDAGRTMREIGGLALPIVHIPNGDVLALRPIFGRPMAEWPVVHAAHDGNCPRTIAPNLRLLVPAWFAEQFDAAELQAPSGALHRFFGGAPATLAMTAAQLGKEIAQSPHHNVAAARRLAPRLSKASAKELEAYLFERDWYYDLEASERALPLLKVAARLLTSPPSRAWLGSPRGRAIAAWVAAGERYDGTAHVALAESLPPSQPDAFAAYHTAAMFAVAYEEFVAPKLMAAARLAGSHDPLVKAVMALC